MTTALKDKMLHKIRADHDSIADIETLRAVRDAALEEAAQAIHNSLTAAQWNVDAWQMHNHVLKTIRNLKSEK